MEKLNLTVGKVLEMMKAYEGKSGLIELHYYVMKCKNAGGDMFLASVSNTTLYSMALNKDFPRDYDFVGIEAVTINRNEALQIANGLELR